MGPKVVAACSIEQILKLSHPDRGLSIQDTDITFVFLVAKIEKWLPNKEGLFNALISDFTNQSIEIFYDKSGSPTDATLDPSRTSQSLSGEDVRYGTVDIDSASSMSPPMIQISSSSSSSDSSLTPRHEPSPAVSAINPRSTKQNESRTTDYTTTADWSPSDKEMSGPAVRVLAPLNQTKIGQISQSSILDSSSASSMRLKPGACYVGNEKVAELLIREIEAQELPSIQTAQGNLYRICE